MTAHAHEAAPNECCGLLAGTDVLIDEAVRIRNVEEGPTRYRIDPEGHFALIKRLRGTRRSVIGAYHSHPRSGASPSPSDIAEALYPDFLYVIVSLMLEGRPQIRGWRIRDGAPSEVELRAV